MLRDLIVSTWKVIAHTPQTMRGAGWACVGAFAISLFLAIFYKDSLQAAIGVGFPTPEPKTITYLVVRFIDTFCGGAGMTVIGVAGYVFARATKRDALADAALVFAAGGFLSFLITGVGQFVFADMRPREGGMMQWFGIHGHGVSGHASAASLFLSPARSVFAKNKSRATHNAIAFAFFSWALFIGWSRIYLDMHHTWNVVLGLSLGFFCAHAASKAYAQRAQSATNNTGTT